MELLSVVSARSLWFLDSREMNPRGRQFRPALINALAERYDFAKAPYDDEASPPNTKESPGFKFFDGAFTNYDGIEVMVNLTIFDDGLFGETRSSTRDSEAFLDEVVAFAVKEFGLVFKPEMIVKKQFVSEIYVSPAQPLSRLNQKLEKIAATLTTALSTPNFPARYEPAGLLFASDPALRADAGLFRFERKADTPFSLNKFYSIAPLPTEGHLQVLNELERILSE